MPLPLHPSSGSRLRFAFTLLEIIVVVIVLAILASLTVPRLAGNDRRQFRATVEQVADLLTMYAQREQLGQKAVGILHDAQRNALELLVLDTESGMSGQSANWYVDHYVQPVQFPAFMSAADVEIIADGDRIDATEYPLASENGQERPWIEIHLRGAGEVANVALPPYGVSPMVNSTSMNSGTLREKYDLDAAGRSREDW